jgi:hypothetical protein
MSWWNGALVAWLGGSLPVGVLTGRVIRLRDAQGSCDGCNHGHAAHLHYRPGTDCGLCLCPEYMRSPGARSLQAPTQRHRKAG